MVACQGGVWLLNDPFLAQRWHCPFVASVADPLVLCDPGGLVAWKRPSLGTYLLVRELHLQESYRGLLPIPHPVLVVLPVI